MMHRHLNPLSFLAVLVLSCLPLVCLTTISKQLVPRDLSHLRLGVSRSALIHSLGPPIDTAVSEGQITDTFLFRQGLRPVRYQVQYGQGNVATAIQRPERLEIARPDGPVMSVSSTQ
jgi:hypothetical protein